MGIFFQEHYIIENMFVQEVLSEETTKTPSVWGGGSKGGTYEYEIISISVLSEQSR